MHKGHLTGCALAIAVALAVFTFTGGSTGGLALLLAALICPLTMGAVMWFLLGGRNAVRGDRTPGDDTSEVSATPRP